MLDEWLDVEDVVLDTVDEVVVGRSPPTIELNKLAPPVVEGLCEIISVI